MKKIIAILLISIYASSAVGLVINSHYCHGQLAKISFLTFGGKQGCGCNPKDMPKDCCKDEMKFQKSDNHRTGQVAQAAELSPFTAELPLTYNYSEIAFEDNDDAGRITNVAQRSCPAPIYLLNRVFLI